MIVLKKKTYKKRKLISIQNDIKMFTIDKNMKCLVDYVKTIQIHVLFHVIGSANILLPIKILIYLKIREYLFLKRI